MHVADDILCSHCIEEPPAVNGNMLRIQLKQVQVTNRIRAFRLFLKNQSRELCERFVIAADNFLLACGKLRELVQLTADNGRLHIRDTVVRRKRNLLVVPRSVRRVLHKCRVPRDAVRAVQEELLIILPAVRHNRSAFSSGDRLDRMEGQCCHIGNAAVRPSLVGGPDDMRSVFNVDKAVFLLQCQKSVLIHRLTAEIDCHHCLGIRRNVLLHRCRIQIVGIRKNICKNRPCPDIECTVCRCRKGNRRGDQLVSGAQSCCHARDMKCRRSI